MNICIYYYIMGLLRCSGMAVFSRFFEVMKRWVVKFSFLKPMTFFPTWQYYHWTKATNFWRLTLGDCLGGNPSVFLQWFDDCCDGLEMEKVDKKLEFFNWSQTQGFQDHHRICWNKIKLDELEYAWIGLQSCTCYVSVIYVHIFKDIYV